MKFIPASLLSLCLGMPSLHALTWAQPTVDLEIDAGTAETVIEFPFQNDRSWTVTITEVKSGCGCATPTVDTKTIPAGGKGEVTVTYKPGDRLGPQEAPLVVKTDEAGVAPVTLYLRVNILPVLVVQPVMLRWTKGEAPAPRTLLLKQVKADVPVRIIDVKPERETVQAVYETGDVPGTWRLTLIPRSTSETSTTKISIHTEVKGRPVTFSAFAVVR